MSRDALIVPYCSALFGCMRYDMRADRTGWTVYDVATDRPVVLDDVVLTGISLDDANKLVDLLNLLDERAIRTARGAGSSRAAY
jgi:hypothetical protein